MEELITGCETCRRCWRCAGLRCHLPLHGLQQAGYGRAQALLYGKRADTAGEDSWTENGWVPRTRDGARLCTTECKVFGPKYLSRIYQRCCGGRCSAMGSRVATHLGRSGWQRVGSNLEGWKGKTPRHGCVGSLWRPTTTLYDFWTRCVFITCAAAVALPALTLPPDLASLERLS